MGKMQNLLPEPPATLLPGDEPAEAALAEAAQADTEEAYAAATGRHPTYSRAWAVLAQRAFAKGSVVTAYAYARTGYHRGLDQLRRNGWKGHGPVPWSHRPNQGFLACLHLLSRAAGEIGESDEAARCAQFLRDCDPAAGDALSGS
jgi:predicted NAD/FAD-binding protein